MNHPLQKHFTQASDHWDLERLYQDLAKVKGNSLTKTEKTHLCGLLCGHSPRDIAETLHRATRSVEAFMCNTLYQYVKQLSNHGEERLRNHRDVLQWLEELGYRKIITTASSSSSPLNGWIQALNTSVHILNSQVQIVNIDPANNKMIILNVLQIEVPYPSGDQKSKETSEGGEIKEIKGEGEKGK